jgi:hypothetical protein
MAELQQKEEEEEEEEEKTQRNSWTCLHPDISRNTLFFISQNTLLEIPIVSSFGNISSFGKPLCLFLESISSSGKLAFPRKHFPFWKAYVSFPGKHFLIWKASVGFPGQIISSSGKLLVAFSWKNISSSGSFFGLLTGSISSFGKPSINQSFVALLLEDISPYVLKKTFPLLETHSYQAYWKHFLFWEAFGKTFLLF